eukprot:244844-Rhodomonas_salina.1
MTTTDTETWQSPTTSTPPSAKHSHHNNSSIRKDGIGEVGRHRSPQAQPTSAGADNRNSDRNSDRNDIHQMARETSPRQQRGIDNDNQGRRNDNRSASGTSTSQRTTVDDHDDDSSRRYSRVPLKSAEAQRTTGCAGLHWQVWCRERAGERDNEIQNLRGARECAKPVTVGCTTPLRHRRVRCQAWSRAASAADFAALNMAPQAPPKRSRRGTTPHYAALC